MKARRGAIIIIAALLIVPITLTSLLDALLVAQLPRCGISPSTACFAGARPESFLGNLVGDNPRMSAVTEIALLVLFWLVVFFAWTASLTKPSDGKRWRNVAAVLLILLLFLMLF